MIETKILAKVGSVVKYSDMANPGSTYVILELPKVNETYGWSSGYTLRSVEEPFTITYSDLRQHGWKIFNDVTETWDKVLWI